METKIKEFPLFETVDEVLNLHGEQIRTKELNLQVELDKDLNVMADQYMVSTIFRNLISNAIKYTPEKGTISSY